MKNLTYLKSKKGFTTTELIIAVGLTSMFATSFYVAFHVMNTEMRRNSVYFDTGSSAKNVMDRMAKDVQEAVSVVASYGGNSTGTTCLILKLPSIDGSGIPTNISTQFDYVTYKVDPSDSTHLLRSLDVLGGTSSREGGADISNVVVARRLDAIAFSYLGTALSSVSASTIPTMKRINVQITAEGTTLGATQQTQIDSDLMLRNRIS